MAYIPLDSLSATLGSAAGRGIAQPVNQALDFLLQNKMQNIVNQQSLAFENQRAQANIGRAEQGFIKAGISPQYASALASFHPDVQKNVLPYFWELSQRDKQAQQVPSYDQSGLDSILANALQQQQQTRPLQEIGRPEPQSSYERMNEFIRSKSGLPPVTPLSSLLSQQPEQQQQPLALAQQATGPQAMAPARPIVPPVSPVRNPFISPEQIRRQEQSEREQKKLEIKEEELELKKERSKQVKSKEARAFLKPFEEARDASESNIRDYKALIKTVKSGNLRSGRTQQLLDKLGWGDFNKNYETQLATKLIGRLALNSRSAFGPGTRITNYLEQVFQRSIPSLWNTPEGIKSISEINMLGDKANKLKAKTASQIIRENKGNVPEDVNDQIYDRLRPQLNQLEDEVINIVDKYSQPKSAKNTNQIVSNLPDASLYKGKRVRNTETGEILTSNGTQWV